MPPNRQQSRGSVAYLDLVGHDTELVQAGLPVEKHHVAVVQMPLHNVARLEVLGQQLVGACNFDGRETGVS